jgi:hypothetical protein
MILRAGLQGWCHVPLRSARESAGVVMKVTATVSAKGDKDSAQA